MLSEMRDFCLVLEDEHKSSREGFVAKGPQQTLVRPHLGLSVTDLSTNLAAKRVSVALLS